MEKSSAHYHLPSMQAEIAKRGIATFTKAARLGVLAMGLTEQEALAVLASLTRRNLYKSMTTYSDHTIWQDVYYAPCPNGKTAYIKLTQVADSIVIQFKEK